MYQPMNNRYVFFLSHTIFIGLPKELYSKKPSFSISSESEKVFTALHIKNMDSDENV